MLVEQSLVRRIIAIDEEVEPRGHRMGGPKSDELTSAALSGVPVSMTNFIAYPPHLPFERNGKKPVRIVEWPLVRLVPPLKLRWQTEGGCDQYQRKMAENREKMLRALPVAFQ